MDTHTKRGIRALVWLILITAGMMLFWKPKDVFASSDEGSYAYLYFYTVDGDEIEDLQKKIGKKKGYSFLNPDRYKYLPAQDGSGKEVYPELYYQVTGQQWAEVDEDGNVVATYKEGDAFNWTAGNHYFYVKTDNPALTGENTQHVSFSGQAHLYFQNVNGNEIFSLEKNLAPSDEYTFEDPAKYAYLYQSSADDPGEKETSDTLSGKGTYWYCRDDNDREYLFKAGDKAKFRSGEYYFTVMTDDPVTVSFYYPIEYDTYYVEDDRSGARYASEQVKVGDTIYLKKSLGALIWNSTFKGWTEENLGDGEIYGGGESFRIMRNIDLDFFAVYEEDDNWDPAAVDENTGESIKKQDEINIADLDTIKDAAGSGYGVAIDANGLLRRTGQLIQINPNVHLKGIPGSIKAQKSLSSLVQGGDPKNPNDYAKDKYGNKMDDSKLEPEINNVLRQDNSAMYMDVYGNAFVYYSQLARKNNLLLAMDRLALGKTDSWVRNVSSWDSEMIKRFEAIEFALIYGTYPKTAEAKEALKAVGVEWRDSYISESAFNKLKTYKKIWTGWYNTYFDGLFEKYRSQDANGTTVVGSIKDAVRNVFGITAYAKEKEQKNDLGEAMQSGARIGDSIDLDNTMFKPQYFDPTRIYSVSTYSFAQLEGLTDEQIRNLTRIFNELVSAGFTEEAAAGACGNLWQESHFNVKSHNSSGYYGMVQWGGSRANMLLKLAASMNTSWDTVEAQIAMVKLELTSTYQSMINNYLRIYYGGVTMQSIKDVDAAAEVWAVAYEGCICQTSSGIHRSHSSKCAMAANKKSYQELLLRKEYAKRVMSAMTKHSGGSGQGGSFAGFSNTEILSSIFGASSVQAIMAQYGNDYSKVQKEMTYITFTDARGRSRKLQCHERIADDLTNALNEISAAGFLLDDVSCYVARKNTSNSSAWSFHALGLAVDVNPAHNPQFFKSQVSNDWIKQHYRPNADPLAVTLQQYYIFKSYGFLWGRDFSTRPDLMHFTVGEVGQDGFNAWISEMCEGTQ